MHRGNHVSCKKEYIKDDDYMGIRKIRFYIKCSVCSAEITFKTNPKNSDYECESGATIQKMEEIAKKQRKEVDKDDTLKSLENQTIEMDLLDELMRGTNSHRGKVDTEKVLETMISIDSTELVSGGENTNNEVDRKKAPITKDDKQQQASRGGRSRGLRGLLGDCYYDEEEEEKE
jgi:hypothetical protein